MDFRRGAVWAGNRDEFGRQIAECLQGMQVWDPCMRLCCGNRANHMKRTMEDAAVANTLGHVLVKE